MTADIAEAQRRADVALRLRMLVRNAQRGSLQAGGSWMRERQHALATIKGELVIHEDLVLEVLFEGFADMTIMEHDRLAMRLGAASFAHKRRDRCEEMHDAYHRAALTRIAGSAT